MHELEQHPQYWPGQEHAFYVHALHRLLKHERQRYTSETERREAWFADRAYHFPALMLVGCFSYIEGVFGRGWIQNFGGRRKRELFVLRVIRNAIVHEAGDLKSLLPYKKPHARKGRPSNIRMYVRRFVHDLRSGRVRNETGKMVPKYIELERNGIVHLNEEAFDVLRQLFPDVLRNAGRIPKR